MGKLTNQQRDDICGRYVAGETPAALAREFGVAAQSLHKLLKKREIYKPVRKVLPLSVSERSEIIDLYKKGESVNRIVVIVQRSVGAICSVLRAEGILKSRSQGKIDRVPSDIRDQAIALYETGKTADEIATLGLHPKLTRSIVFNELRRRGIQTRRGGARGVFWQRPADQKRVCEYYQKGMSGCALADIYECSRDAINKVLTEASIEVRSFDEATGLKWTDAAGRVFYMRSLWEIKTAKWLDESGRRWDYEKCCYDIGAGRTYTPDFWVYEGGELLQLIDVKGWLRPTSAEAIAAFKENYPQFPFVMWDESQLREKGILDIKIKGEDVDPGPSYPVCVSRTTDEEKDRIAEIYSSGKTILETAALSGRSHTIVSQVVNGLGIIRSKAESKRGRIPQEKRDQATALYLTGLSITNVAKETGLSRDVVWGEVKRRGIRRPMRSQDG